MSVTLAAPTPHVAPARETSGPEAGRVPTALGAVESAVRKRAMSFHPAGSARRAGDPIRVEAPSFPTDRDVRALASAQHPLSVSVLLATTPSERMTARDARELFRLAAHAEQRLAREDDVVGVARVQASLAAAVARAIDGPTDRGLAILASPEQVHVHLLHVRPVERVVLDPTFATRDLVRSTAEDPPFLMLVLDPRAARLFHYDQRFCRPILGHDFPMLRPDDSRWARAEVGVVDRIRQERVRGFLRGVDAHLAARVAEHGLPVVLVASHRMAEEFAAVGRSGRIAAVIRSSGARMPLEHMQQRARAALADHVGDRAAAALDTVHSHRRTGRAVAGLVGAWEAMLRDDPHLLVVERSLSAAVHVAPDGSISPADDPDVPGVIDDAVDELIEATLNRGAEVVIVPDGSLAHHGRLVLVVRGSVHRARWGGGVPGPRR